MPTVFVSLGSNVVPAKNISLALKALRYLFDELTLSTIYESKPVGFLGHNFYNLVVAFETELTLNIVTNELKQIEKAQGRSRIKNQVTIDLDILLYGDFIDKSRNLPRDDITQKAFVLRPLSEIAAHLKHPILGTYYHDLWNAYPKKKHYLWPVKNVIT